MSFVKLPDGIAWNAIETVSGRYFDVSNPHVDGVSITDIAWSLSRQARFAGHTMSEEVWTVAQHALFVERLLELALGEEAPSLATSLGVWMNDKGFVHHDRLHWACPKTVRLGGLHHDDSEAYLIDLPSPIKRIEALRAPYKELEVKVTTAVNLALDLPELTDAEHEMVLWADLMALQIEAANLMPSRGRGWWFDLPQMTMSDIHLFPKAKHWKLVYEEFLSKNIELHALPNRH